MLSFSDLFGEKKSQLNLTVKQRWGKLYKKNPGVDWCNGDYTKGTVSSTPRIFFCYMFQQIFSVRGNFALLLLYREQNQNPVLLPKLRQPKP